MTQTYFKINYEFDRAAVHRGIATRLESGKPGYICVCDGVILNIADRTPDYLNVINGSMFSICDSSYVPLYIRWIYGQKYGQYAGSEIFMDIVRERKYRMIFLGTSQRILDGLKSNLVKENPDVETMQFVELPFRKVEDFDYAAIARMVQADGAQIIWVALGAPKQEQFMARLQPHLEGGVMIAVGAAFKFFSGIEAKRAPQWMIRNHLEFVYRLAQEPRKQFGRCFNIVRTLPGMLYGEWRRKRSRV